ncbi:MAG: hypothetical protein JWR90_3502, partial [Marmoricola sp.]|nr:hypothetical protein [Marmoricola sp.]
PAECRGAEHGQETPGHADLSRPHGHDHDADPVDFVDPRLSHAIDLRTFSRRREVGDGPTSVMG